MKKITRLVAIPARSAKTLFSCAAFLLALGVQAQFKLDLESGAIFSSPYNLVRIPGNTGTTIDLAKDLQVQATWYYRVRVGYTFNDRHTVSLLFSPQTVNSSGIINRDVDFSGTTFRAGSSLESSYKFNNYRLTYRYDLVRQEKLRFGLGLTAFIRDADIVLTAAGNSTNKPDIGFVPLLNYYLQWNPTGRLLLISEADASYIPIGQAFDVFAGLGYRLNEHDLAESIVPRSEQTASPPAP